MSNKFKPNDMIGNWLLLKEVERPKEMKTKGVYWQCQCQCENKTISVIFEGRLSSGRTKSCGCSRIKDLTNQLIGKLIPQYYYKKDGETYWHCNCQCGNTCEVPVSKLTGKVKKLSCGCLRLERIKESYHKTNSFRYENNIAYGTMSNGIEFIVDAEDVPKIQNICWYLNKQGYVVSGDKRLNRIITGCENDKFVVDHWNRNPLDNRKSNLRIVTQHCNVLNSSKRNDNTSGMTGVWFDKKNNKWCAEIKLNDKKYFIGRYGSKIEAIQKRFEYECLLFDIYSPYYQKNDTFICEACGYKLTLSRKTLKPIKTEVKEISFEDLKNIKSERSDGALGSSLK